MRPSSMPSALTSATLPPLPGDKTLLQIVADYIAYLFSCAKKFITETHVAISAQWGELCRTVVIMMGHPNGWEGVQQQQLRRAAVMAGLVPNTQEGRSRIRFLCEGEASLHFCLQANLLPVQEVSYRMDFKCIRT